MKKFLQMNKMLILMLWVTAVILAACTSPETSSNPAVIEVPVSVSTPEPTPTTPVLSLVEGVVCIPLPDDMTIDIQFESSLYGVIEVTGLQPGEKPTLLLTGQGNVLSDWWQKETQYENAVGADGHMSYRFDFRSWPSIEEYTFRGQFIHQRGVACFDIILPKDEVQENRILNGRLVAAEDETQPLPGVLLRLEPEGEPVAQTDANGRFTIATAPTTPLRLYAQRLDYAIPAGTETLDLGDVPYPPLQSLILSPDDYPPSATPYWIEAGDFWLVHTPEGELFAFAPLSPAYAEAIDVDECHYTWDETGSRFVDPCSGDEWELNGMLNLEQSTELWSNRDLDQFYVGMQEGFIFVQFTGLIQGQPVSERPLAVDAHTGITVTAVTAIYSPTATTIDMVTLVDPIWQMNPTAFPQQIAHLHFTMPDALIDDQGRSTAPVSQEGEPAVFDAATGGLRGMMHNQLEAIAADSETITVTMTMELLNLARQLELPLVWEGHQVGDVWDVAVPLEIGYAGAQIEQVEWLETLPDDSARLNLTVTDASPEDIRLYCLHLTTSTPEEQTCPNFDGDLTYTIDVQPGEPVELYVLAWLELKRPFTLVLDVP